MTIAVPTVDHLAVARPFLERGIHVLVEKPMAASLAEANEMVSLASASGAMLAVGHTERFNPAIALALPSLQTPRFIEVHRLSGFPERSMDIDVIFDLMIHDLDIILAVDRIAGRCRGSHWRARADAEDRHLQRAHQVRVRAPSPTSPPAGSAGTRCARCASSSRTCTCQWTTARRNWKCGALRPRPGERPAIEGGAVPVTKDEPLGRELKDFVAAIREGRPPLVTGDDGLRALTLATRVAEAVAASPWPVQAQPAELRHVY